MKALALQYPRYGYRRINVFMARQGEPMSMSRAWRLWKKAGLQVPRKRPRKRVAHLSPPPLPPAHANHVWSYDFIFDSCANGQQLKCLTLVDEFTRECLLIDVAGSIRSRRLIELLGKLISERGVPRYLRSDNGPEFIARSLSQWAHKQGLQMALIEPGKHRSATYQSLVPGRFYGAILKGIYLDSFTITLKDDTVFEFSWYNSRLRAVQDRWGNRLGIVRDSSDKIVQVSSPNGRFLRFRHGNPDCATCITQVIDNIGRQTNYEYDTSGRLIRTTNPSGGITTYTYDSATNRMLTVQDPRNHAGQVAQPKVTNVYYSAADGANLNGKVKKQTYADGTSVQFAYQFDANGKVKQTDVTNGRGYIRRIEYTDDGLIAKETKALGTPEQQITINAWDNATRLLSSSTDALNRTTTYEYDAQGNLTQVTRMAGTVEAANTQYTYTSAYNLVETITDPLNHVTRFFYDAKGNLTEVTDANGNSVSYAYNNAGQLTQITNALNKSVQFSYSDGNLARITDSLNRSLILGSDAVGRLRTVTDALNNTTSTTWDARDRPVEVIDPMGRPTNYSWDPNGNLLEVRNAKGNSHPFVYDSRNAVSREEDPLGQAETYLYDANHNLTQKTDRKGQITRYAYDGLDRLTEITYADNSTATYAWDKGNRLIQIVDSQNGTITNTYDNLDRLTQQVTPKGTVDYTYYANGLRQTMTVAGQPTLTYTYDDANRLTRIDQAAGASNNNTAQSITFAYDVANRRIQTKLANAQTINYTYDDADQLTAIVYKNANGTVLGDLSYSYDLAGQRTLTGGSLAGSSLPEAIVGAVDPANRLTGWDGKTLTYDLNGNLTSDGTNTYTWNARDQLIQISGTTNATFSYDALGRRQSKITNATGTGYVYDGHNIVQELLGVATSNAYPGNIRANYLIGGIDEVFAQQTGSGITAQTLNYLTDALGSPIRLTDQSGAKVVDYTYDPYGNTTSDAMVDNPFQYTGRENDGTGLYYYRARYYSPKQQRFISEDPIGLVGGINLYGYVGGNPISRIDPDGRFFFVPFFGWGAATALADLAIMGGLTWAWQQSFNQNNSSSGSDTGAGAGAGVGTGTGAGSGSGTGSCPPPDDDCEEEWDYAYKKCNEWFSQPNPSRKLTGGYTNLYDCARGHVSERCGGNRVDWGRNLGRGRGR
jgi:RHS repeat-associated protein